MRKNNKNIKTRKKSQHTSTTINHLVKKLLKLQIQIKFKHWNTTSYKTHMVTDKFSEKISGHIDMLVEVLIGQGHKLSPVTHYYNDIDDITTRTSLHHILTDIIKNIKDIISPNNVKAILDDIVIDIHRFNYLMVMS